MQRIGTFLKFRPAMLAPRIALTEGLTDPTVGLIMGSTAELLAREFSISREEADAYAVESHRRAAAARDASVSSPNRPNATSIASPMNLST